MRNIFVQYMYMLIVCPNCTYEFSKSLLKAQLCPRTMAKRCCISHTSQGHPAVGVTFTAHCSPLWLWQAVGAYLGFHGKQSTLSAVILWYNCGLSQIEHSLAAVYDIHLASPCVYHIHQPTHTVSNTYNPFEHFNHRQTLQTFQYHWMVSYTPVPSIHQFALCGQWPRVKIIPHVL